MDNNFYKQFIWGIEENILPKMPDQWIDMDITTPDGSVENVISEEGHSWQLSVYNNIVRTMCLRWGSYGTNTHEQPNLTVVNSSFGYRGPLYFLPVTNRSDGQGFGGAAHEGGTGGIRVGTSDTAWTLAQYNLQGAIAHGNSTGQLYHNLQTNGSVSYVSETKTYSYYIRRMFNNNTAASIIVREAGLYFYDYASAGDLTLFSRDVLSSPVTVASGDRLTVTYTLSCVVDVPA